MGATTGLSLISTIANGDFETPQRIGCFSYGSGCCSEFFSGIVRKEGQERLHALGIEERLDKRYELSMDEYDELLVSNKAVKFGTRDAVLDTAVIPGARTALDQETLFLSRIKDFHREYEWVS